MKRILFIASHLFSGSDALYKHLDQYDRVHGFRTNGQRMYWHPLDFLEFTERRHKLPNMAAIYMEEVLFNYCLGTKDAYKYCKFIYVVRPPRPVLNLMVASKQCQPAFAYRYYCYRLRRLCEMAKRTPKAVLLTWDDLSEGRGIDLIEKYLTLKQSIPFDPDLLRSHKSVPVADLLHEKLLQAAERAYEKYLHFLKHQALVYPT